MGRSLETMAMPVETMSAAERQTAWAEERTAMAFERTFAAWVRTGLAALAFGIAMHGLKAGEPGFLFRFAETGLIVFAAMCFVAGLRRVRASRRFAGGSSTLILGLMPAMSLSLTGASTAALFEIWRG